MYFFSNNSWIILLNLYFVSAHTNIQAINLLGLIRDKFKSKFKLQNSSPKRTFSIELHIYIYINIIYV